MHRDNIIGIVGISLFIASMVGLAMFDRAVNLEAREEYTRITDIDFVEEQPGLGLHRVIMYDGDTVVFQAWCGGSSENPPCDFFIKHKKAFEGPWK